MKIPIVCMLLILCSAGPSTAETATEALEKALAVPENRSFSLKVSGRLGLPIRVSYVEKSTGTPHFAFPLGMSAKTGFDILHSKTNDEPYGEAASYLLVDSSFHTATLRYRQDVEYHNVIEARSSSIELTSLVVNADVDDLEILIEVLDPVSWDCPPATRCQYRPPGAPPIPATALAKIKATYSVRLLSSPAAGGVRLHFSKKLDMAPGKQHRLSVGPGTPISTAPYFPPIIH